MTVLVADATTSAPIQNANVRATINGQTAGTGTTNTSGGALLSLNAGTYTITAAAGGYAGTAVTATVATGSQSIPVSLAAQTVPAPANPGAIIGTVTKTDGSGRPLAGAIFTFQLVADPAGDDVSGSTSPFHSLPTDSNGHAFVEFVAGWVYQAWAGPVLPATPALSGSGIRFTAPNANFAVPTILGP